MTGKGITRGRCRGMDVLLEQENDSRVEDVEGGYPAPWNVP